LGEREDIRMNSRLERLKSTIYKCEQIEETFSRRGVRGQEPKYYDDILAGFEAPVRSGFFLSWSLVFVRPDHSNPKEKQEGREPTYIDVGFSGGEFGDRLIEVTYRPENNVWLVKGSKEIGNDGTEAVRNLAADCRLSAGETRQVSQSEAMWIIAMLANFYVKQPV
jgi:hypothetical protein